MSECRHCEIHEMLESHLTALTTCRDYLPCSVGRFDCKLAIAISLPCLVLFFTRAA